MSRRKWPQPDESRRCPECRLIGVHLGNCPLDPDPLPDDTLPTPDVLDILMAQDWHADAPVPGVAKLTFDFKGDRHALAQAVSLLNEVRSVPTPCATCGHYADGHDFTPPNDCHATPTCDCETGYVPTRPDEPLTVERLTAALVKVGGLHRYTWEEYATAIIAALGTTDVPPEADASGVSEAPVAGETTDAS